MLVAAHHLTRASVEAGVRATRAVHVQTATVQLHSTKHLNHSDAVAPTQRQRLSTHADVAQTAHEPARDVISGHLTAEVDGIVVEVEDGVADGRQALADVLVVDGELGLATVALDADAVPQSVVDAHVRAHQTLATAAVEAVLHEAVDDLQRAKRA